MERDVYIDILKGMGIISIVIGHSSWILSINRVRFPIEPFVYSYHLMLFYLLQACALRKSILWIHGYMLKEDLKV